MAEVFAPFVIQRTMQGLTFYCMEGRNFVRTKSSLSRRKVLYAPCFARTREYAALMGQASKIGSFVYNTLPVYWRQSWMYRSFTGEAFTMLKAGEQSAEIQQVLWERYVKEIVSKKPAEAIKVSSFDKPKRAYRKLNTGYWKGKTIKSARRKARKEQTMYYAGLMAQASKIGAKLYAQLRGKYAGRHYYQYLTGQALKLLKQEISAEDILADLSPTLPGTDCSEAKTQKKAVNVVRHQKGQYYFIPSLYKRFSGLEKVFPKAAIILIEDG
ncbi:hypothetical protein A3860_34135 [Niastella vici]|uniref:Uncharacterized protein n=1 Tax=Niastella vici TaxID=1703345 RepID=A0A1V9FPX0_9BACT|nr:hypothetical protein [Niastella vici]OQP60419.1 hypothetical protein A3860_34135 [Niastella vici]